MYGLISADREWGSGKEQRSYNMSGGPSLAPHLRTGEPLLSISANIAHVIFTMLVIINRISIYCALHALKKHSSFNALPRVSFFKLSLEDFRRLRSFYIYIELHRKNKRISLIRNHISSF